jgi:hypothetical protein
MRRRWWILLGIVLVASSGLALAIKEVLRDPITHENYARVAREGVAEAEVVEVLGRPADYAAFIATQKSNGDLHLIPVKVWHGNRLKFMLGFNEVGTVDPDSSSAEGVETPLGKFHRWWLDLTTPASPASTPLTPYRIHGGVGPNSSSL